jgi:phospholipid transport system substrate-binding protein
MLTALKAERENLEKNPAGVYRLVDQIVLPNFDFERMSMLVLGKNWQRTSDAQKQEFVQVFRDLLVRTYAVAIAKAVLKPGSEVEIEYLPVYADTASRWVTVKTLVKHEGNTFAIDYNVYPTEQREWKVFNVVVEGISLVTNYRTEFNNDISNIGMDQLIAKIKTRNEAEINRAIETQ